MVVPTTRGQRIWTLVVLCGASILAFLDRSVFVMLLVVISKELALNDTQTGILIGSFALMQSICAVPLGLLSDSVPRRRFVLMMGMVLWSITTALSSTPIFGVLVVVRGFVGLGEAILMPSALAIVNDIFPESERFRAGSIMGFTPFLGTGVSYAVSGLVLGSSSQSIWFPGLGHLQGWQMCFVTLGAVGLFYPVLFLTIQDGSTPTSSYKPLNLRFKFSQLWSQRIVVVALLFKTISQGFLASAWFGWAVPFFSRVVLIAPSTASLTLAVFDPLAALCGAALFGSVADALIRRGQRFVAPSLILWTVTALITTSIVRCFFVSPPAVAFVFQGLFSFSYAGLVGLVLSFAQQIAPLNCRALYGSMLVLMVNAGMAMGPPIVGAISDFHGGNLLLGLFIVSGIGGVFALMGGVALFAVVPKYLPPEDLSSRTESMQSSLIPSEESETVENELL